MRKAAKRRLARAQAEEDLARLGVPVEVHPSEAMLNMVYVAYGNRLLADAWVRELPEDPREWSKEDWIVKRISDEEGEKVVKWAKACRDAGVEEHRVALAEKQGELLAEVLRSLLTGLQGTLIAAGLAEQVVRRVFSTDVPPLVRAALTSASGEGR